MFKLALTFTLHIAALFPHQQETVEVHPQKTDL